MSETPAPMAAEASGWTWKILTEQDQTSVQVFLPAGQASNEVVLSMNCTGDQANVYVDRPSADPVHIALPGYFIPDGEQAKYNAKKRRFTIRLQRVEAPRSQSPKGPAALDEDDVDDTSTFHDACSETAADSETAVSEAATATTQEEPKPQPTQRSPKKKQRSLDLDLALEPDSEVQLTTNKDKPLVAADVLHGPFIRTGFGKSETKGEDKWLESPGNKFELPALEAATGFSAYGVFDGHGGKQSATYANKHLLQSVSQYVSRVSAPLPELHPLPGATEADVRVWAVQDAMVERLPKAMHSAFLEVDSECQRRFKQSGTTATLAVSVGWELLVANVGDSCAFLDTGSEIIQISGNHRVNENPEEQQRVKSLGGSIAQSDVDGVIAGPLRVWPGGLAMTRSLGDAEAGALVFGEPEIRQVTVPAAGARLILASDGLWDAVVAKTIIHKIRKMVAGAAANTALHTALERKGLADDITVMVIDFCSDPNEKIPAPLTAGAHHDKGAHEKEVCQFWKPLDACTTAWRERTTSRRLAALNLLAAELAAKQQTAEAAASAAAAAASSDKGASTAEAGVSDTYRELAEAHVDLEDLDGLDMSGESSAVAQGGDDGEWTTVKGKGETTHPVANGGHHGHAHGHAHGHPREHQRPERGRGRGRGYERGRGHGRYGSGGHAPGGHAQHAVSPFAAASGTAEPEQTQAAPEPVATHAPPAENGQYQGRGQYGGERGGRGYRGRGGRYGGRYGGRGQYGQDNREPGAHAPAAASEATSGATSAAPIAPPAGTTEQEHRLPPPPPPPGAKNPRPVRPDNRDQAQARGPVAPAAAAAAVVVEAPAVPDTQDAAKRRPPRERDSVPRAAKAGPPPGFGPNQGSEGSAATAHHGPHAPGPRSDDRRDGHPKDRPRPQKQAPAAPAAVKAKSEPPPPVADARPHPDVGPPAAHGAPQEGTERHSTGGGRSGGRGGGRGGRGPRANSGPAAQYVSSHEFGAGFGTSLSALKMLDHSAGAGSGGVQSDQGNGAPSGEQGGRSGGRGGYGRGRGGRGGRSGGRGRGEMPPRGEGHVSHA